MIFSSLSRILSIQDRAAEDAVVEELTISTDSNTTAAAFAPNPAMPNQDPSLHMMEGNVFITQLFSISC